MEMVVPEQVQNQVKAAEALQQKLYGNPSPEPAPAEPPVATPEPVVEQQSATEPETPEPVVTPVKAEPTQEVEYWRKRFETVQGMLNAELPKLNQQLKERDQRLEELEAKMKEKTAEPESLVSDRDVEDFGSDLVDMVRRASTEVFDKRVSALTSALEKRFAELTAKLGTVEGTVVQNETDRFWGKVKSLVPNFDEVNVDPRWIEFLDTAPEFSVETYRELAGKAIATGDADKVAKLVKAWEATLPATKTKQKQQTNQAELERQIAPSTARASQPATANAGQKIWSAAEYEYVFSNQARNERTTAELDALQQDAMRAVAEGRIRW